MSVNTAILQALKSVIECNCGTGWCKDCALKIIDVTPPIPQIDVEEVVVCNLTTDNWEKRVTTYTDWVAGAPVITDLGIPCSEDQPIPDTYDIESVEVCDATTGTIHVLTSKHTTVWATGVTTTVQISDIDTLVECNKVTDESISEIPVCAAGVTLIKKTKLESDGTETEVFYGDNGAVVPTPAAYTIGECKVAVPDVDIEFISGCSDIDGRMIVTRIVTDKLTNTDTRTLLESDLTTVVTDGSVMVNCSGADYELVSEACLENAAGDKFKVVTFVNPTDETDTYKIYTNNLGNVVPEPTGLSPCVSDCETRIGFNRCFDTGAGSVSVQGYYTLSAWNIETYTVAKIIASTDPAYSVWDDVLADVPTWDQISCESPTEDEIDTPLTIVTGTGDVPAGFKSVTINNITGITIVAWGYELGDGRRDNSISFWTERWNNINELLPAITATGGTFQWIGLN